MYGPGKLKLFLPVAKEGRGRGSNAERPLGIGVLRQVIQSDFRGGPRNGIQKVACQGGMLEIQYLSYRLTVSFEQAKWRVSNHALWLGAWDEVGCEQPSSNLQSLPPWQISVRGTHPSNFTPEPWRSARMPSTDKTDPRHTPYRNLELSSTSCSCSPY
jgi:hypothetical protein